MVTWNDQPGELKNRGKSVRINFPVQQLKEKERKNMEEEEKMDR